MDVDADNFEEALGLLELHLPKAAYVAVDLEMTGIMGPPDTKVCAGDVPQVQYTKSRAVVCRPYNIVQVGICLFEERTPGHFECRPFNVFVFPRPFHERDSEGRQVKVDDHFMGLSASSMRFLSGNGLDFNRWVSKGVSYTRGDIEEELLKTLPGAAKEGSAPPAKEGGGGKDGKDKPEPTKPQDITLVNDIMQKVADFAASGGQEMKLPNMKLRNKIAESHPHLTVEKRANPSNPSWQERWVTNLSEDGLRARDAVTRQRIMSHIGFRRMWNLLKTHRRPIVLHNGFFDLLFMHQAFEAPLPHALEEFKGVLRNCFPNIFDTKVLAEAAVLAGILGTSRSALPELATFLEKKLVKYTAGYDAWQTGRIFGFFRAHLGDAKALDFANRVYLMFSAFELCISTETDRLMFDGIARHLYDIDTTALNQRGLVELLKPILEEGKRQYAIKWCNDNRSLLLVIHGSEDVAADAAERDAIEKCLDGLLEKQVEQSRLQFRRLEEYVDSVAKAAEVKDERSAGAGAADPS
eukprot:CAMPEP_0177226132 /NCGR_PEP_ID=MMETSP0367-20130122/39916_1 /TAXON_ID=447022 ORGANISM="Scrippsiella hangoei-like, Strain SHHI-4" /NCGR_SAMPLE_ID=MMETSP0367 /ASSEMBLY_ACC=CAM_ASM_000362 /LENGTH=523 /DNA_ID=CAMNT_0018676271 /DNA_START=83 /DNA_END=1652 /DNA_ORIENTATION=-